MMAISYIELFASECHEQLNKEINIPPNWAETKVCINLSGGHNQLEEWSGGNHGNGVWVFTFFKV